MNKPTTIMYLLLIIGIIILFGCIGASYVTDVPFIAFIIGILITLTAITIGVLYYAYSKGKQEAQDRKEHPENYS